MRRLSAFVLLLVAIAVYGCSKPPVRCTSPEDNPRHHYLSGMELLDRGLFDSAAEKFSRASWCDEKFAPAHAGAAITVAIKGGDPLYQSYKGPDRNVAANEELKKAKKLSKTPEDLFAYRLASMRVATVLKGEDWLEDVQEHHKAAWKLKVDEGNLIFYQGRESADYFMGAAYLEAREFQKARDSFSSVLNSKKDGRWHGPSDKAWKRTDKMVRAISGITLGDVGKTIALRDTVSRADMAALLIDELKVDKLFMGRIPVKPKEARFVPHDVLASPFKEEVSSLIGLGVRGLEPSYDETTRANIFRPDEPVKRKELALALEDIVIKLTGNEKIASAFLGHGQSPFPDVAPSSSWYNAIMSVTTRNLMETELSGEFRPDDAVDGAEAIMAIRTLKHQLNIY
ncbi:MAG: S-layer protein [Deltaproteobacteria bacterium GWA2_55_10]|nr:MAG: S-layer protein [Deltaproteobacteria bacterium GWA2_55_10]